MISDDGHAKTKRRSPRIVGPFKARWCGAMKVPLVVHDLSVGGCMVLSSNASLPNQHLILEIDLPDGHTITVEAQPLYVRRSVGFAVKFINVPQAVDMRLQRTIAALAAKGMR